MYMAILSQGQGCDYTIECGTKVIELKAKNKADALIELNRMMTGPEGDGYDVEYTIEGGDGDLDTVTLLEVSHREKVDLSVWKRQIKDARKKVKESQQEKEERATYERLQKKYGK